MGMTFSLLMIPTTLIGSLAVTMIPSISELSNNIDEHTLSDTSTLKSKINFSIKTSLVFSSILISSLLILVMIQM